MGEGLVYSLCNGREDSNRYYEHIASYGDRVILQMNKDTPHIVKDFMDFLQVNHIEPLREELEYSLEVLILGVLWRCYISRAVALHPWEGVVLTKLSKLRKRQVLKKPVDSLRGILGTLYLSDHSNLRFVEWNLLLGRNMRRGFLLSKENESDIKGNFQNAIKLIDWLEATGEFNYEVKRLKNWLRFLKYKSEDQVISIISKALELAKWFEHSSEAAIDRYTQGVEAFRQKVDKEYKWREDFIFCGRKRLEYHLNMAGAEILNRAYRQEFLKTKKKLVLLPSCMRIHQDKCRAFQGDTGYQCGGCNSQCPINRYTKLGQELGFQVYIIYHQSEAFKNANIKEGTIGIIGVTCALNLIAGGFNAKDLGFVPQCVLLDYCGCRDHWTRDGIVTCINKEQFLKVYEKQD